MVFSGKGEEEGIVFSLRIVSSKLCKVRAQCGLRIV